MPKKLGDLTTFAKMLATRYNGRTGHGSVVALVGLERAEPAAVPDAAVRRQEDRRPGELREALQGGLRRHQGGQPAGARSRSARPRRAAATSRSPGVSATIAPGTFAQLLSQVKGLKFDAWAHHPYPTSPNLPPMQKVRYPNVTLSTMSKFESDLKKWFHRPVPIWITEYGHETKPAEPHGVTLRAAGGLREAGADVREEGPEHPDVHLVHVPRQRRQPVAERPGRPVGRAEAGVRHVRRGRAPDRRLDDRRQGGRARPRDDVRAVPRALLAARRRRSA